MQIFVTLVTTCFFSLLAILSLNYSIFLWEDKKVSDLTRQIKHTADGILQKSRVSRNFTSVDLGNAVGKNKALQAVENIYDRAITTFKHQEYPTWFTKLVDEINLFRKNVWKYLIRFFKYLISLTKPTIKDEVLEKNTADQKNKQDEVHEMVERVNSIDDENLLDNDLIEYDEVPMIDVEPVTKEESIDESGQGNLATISFAASDKIKNEKDMSIFEKLESRILEKLKNEGFDQYDIWLELGNLYQKYGENEKAVEIYALVLKHSEGEEKMIARDKLIGLT